MSRLFACLLCLIAAPLAADSPPSSRGDLLLLLGAPGAEEYGAQFHDWANQWTRTAAEAGWNVASISDPDGDQQPLDLTIAALTNAAEESSSPLWLVMIGHGTYDGRSANFNLAGPDLESKQLEKLLAPLQRPVVVVNCSSASAPFLPELAGPNRVVITATKSGNETSFARFGGYLAQSINQRDADLDKDEQVSLLEAFLLASRLTEEFYAGEGRLATEHAMLDDNGDGRPVSASAFQSLEPVRRDDPEGVLPDGLIAHQTCLVPNDLDARLSPELIARRNEIERQAAALKLRKSEMAPDDYYASLEPLFLELARIAASAGEPPPSDPAAASP